MAVAAAVQEAGAALRPKVTANADTGSPFITLTVTSSDASVAAGVADSYAATLPRVVTELDQAPAGTELPQLSVLEPARTPGQPFSPDLVQATCWSGWCSDWSWASPPHCWARPSTGPSVPALRTQMLTDAAIRMAAASRATSRRV